MANLNNCIILFDIDGTLLKPDTPTNSPGLRAMNAAVETMTGRTGLAEQISFAGATDLGIANKLLEMADFPAPSEDDERRFIAHYNIYMQKFIRKGDYTLLGDPLPVVDILQRDGATIGLGTGNTVVGAFEKLKNVGIHQLFSKEYGGFGDDAKNRDELIRIAARRCGARNDSSVIVVGDTAKDIYAANANSFYSIGITASAEAKEQLRRAGASHALNSVDIDLYNTILEMI